MRWTVYKYEAKPGVFTLDLPVGSQVLHCAVQREQPCIWARVNDGELKQKRKFVLVGTGHEAPSKEEGHYIGTCILMDGALVFHLFEVLL